MVTMGSWRPMPPRFRLIFILFLWLSSPTLQPFDLRAQAAGDAVVSKESTSSSLTTTTTTTTSPFDVGVILDRKTWTGNISWTCMSMAVEDFYAAHPNYSTRLVFHWRDAERDDAFSAAKAAVDLLKNFQVQAIIGPQSSLQAKFLTKLGNKTQVPIISFSAKSSSLSTKHSTYFIRTALNDSSQAEVVASIVKYFKWREVVPIFEDSDYGVGIVPYLIEALQDVGAHVPSRSMLPLSATEEQIRDELSRLKKKQTRVFVVHMSYSLGFQLFSYAKDAGMMEEGYVWIITYGLTDVLDLMGSSATDTMQGVLGIKPYGKETSKLHDFSMRWKKKFSQENPNAKITEPTNFGLWAYDTVWALAIAAESVGLRNATFLKPGIGNSSTDLVRLGISQNGPKLLSTIKSTNFDGMSGKFQLIDGQLESKIFQIINVVAEKKRKIGFWTRAYGASRHFNSNADLKYVIWPGKPKAVPKGWEWPTSGNSLKIGVPVKPGFKEFVDIQKGYCVQVFNAVIAELPYPVNISYVPYANSKGESNGTYDELIYDVFLQKFDAVVGDITIIANRSLYVDFTLPYTESGVSMLVPIKDKMHKSALTFLDPMTTRLWLATGAFFVFIGFVVWILEHRINKEFRGTPKQQVGTVFYFTFSTLVFAHREKVLNNLSRVVLVIWLFMVLIITSSYTASLSSMLTVQQLQPTVTDLDSLLRNGDSVGYLNDSFMPGLLKNMKFPDSKLIPYNSPEDYNEALSNGSVAAIVDEIPYLKVFLSHYCGNYAMVGPTYKTDGFGFVFPKGSPLVSDVSRAILKVTESNIMTTFEDKLYQGRNCSEQAIATNSSSLSFNSFWGLFLLTGITSMFALLVHLFFFLYKHRNVLIAQELNLTFAEKLELLAKLFNQTGESAHELEMTAYKNEAAAVGEQVAAPSSISEPDSPSRMSNLDFEPDEEFGTPPEEEETPGREISRQILDLPSFSDMLNQRG